MPLNADKSRNDKKARISEHNMTFANGNSPHAIKVPPVAEGQAVFEALKLERPKSLIMISGGADGMDPEIKPRLTQLFSRGLVPAAEEIGAALITGGTDAGVMAVLGQTKRERGSRIPLIGVVPEGCTYSPDPAAPSQTDSKAALEPNHSHFVLVDSDDWGGEIESMFNLSKYLCHQIPGIMVLINGGDLACNEVLYAVRMGLPVIVVEGSGRMADTIAGLYREKPEFIEDPRLAEIIADGNLLLFSLKRQPYDLQQVVYRQLRGDSTLKLAWRQFGLYDLNANIQQNRFRGLQLAILVLGVLGTALVLVQNGMESYTASVWEEILRTHLEQGIQGVPDKPLWMTGVDGVIILMRYMIIGVPILISMLLAASNYFNAGTKWILLRGSAENIKREIYRYRARAEIYSDAQTVNATREVKLSNKIQAIGRQLMQTEVNLCAMEAYRGDVPDYYGNFTPLYSTDPKDDGMSPLRPQQYLSARLEDQLNYYVGKAAKLERQLKKLQWMFYIAGGIGTLLAALGMEVWIALTTAIATALVTYMEYQQLEKTLMKNNQAATDLFNVRTWWVSLTPEEQTLQSNIDILVGNTEKILQAEFRDWVQEMQDAMEELKERQEESQEQLKKANVEDIRSGAVLLPKSKEDQKGGDTTTAAKPRTDASAAKKKASAAAPQPVIDDPKPQDA